MTPIAHTYESAIRIFELNGGRVAVCCKQHGRERDCKTREEIRGFFL